MIIKRKEQMNNSTKKWEGSDFLTLLLNDDLFKDNEESIIDECLSFMLAAT